MRIVVRVPTMDGGWWTIAVRLGAFVLLALFLLATWWTARFYTSIDNRTIRYALAFITVQGVILVSLALGLIASKAVILRKEKIHRAWQDRIDELLTDALLSHTHQPELLQECHRHPDQAEAAFSVALRRLRGEARTEAERLFLASGLYERLAKDVLSRRSKRAMFAVTLVREVDKDEAREAVRAALFHPAPIVRLAARVAVLKNGTEQAKRDVLEHVGSLPFWQRIALFHYVPNNSELIHNYLQHALESGHDETVLAALEFVLTRQKGFPMPPDLPLELQKSPNIEVRIKLFKTLPFLCDSSSASCVLKAGLEDPDWRVRSMAAKACGIIHAIETGDVLLQLARKSASPVEVAHAARAALTLRSDAALELEQLAVQSEPDKAAVITEILAEARKGVAA